MNGFHFLQSVIPNSHCDQLKRGNTSRKKKRNLFYHLIKLGGVRPTTKNNDLYNGNSNKICVLEAFWILFVVVSIIDQFGCVAAGKQPVRRDISAEMQSWNPSAIAWCRFSFVSAFYYLVICIHVQLCVHWVSWLMSKVANLIIEFGPDTCYLSAAPEHLNYWWENCRGDNSHLSHYI